MRRWARSQKDWLFSKDPATSYCSTELCSTISRCWRCLKICRRVDLKEVPTAIELHPGVPVQGSLTKTSKLLLSISDIALRFLSWYRERWRLLEADIWDALSLITSSIRDHSFKTCDCSSELPYSLTSKTFFVLSFTHCSAKIHCLSISVNRKDDHWQRWVLQTTRSH